MRNKFIPKINTEFVCIINRRQPALAAVISSYIAKDDQYLAIFEFSDVTTSDTEVDDDFIDEHIITRTRAREFNILMRNSLAQLRTCKNIILAGLSANQMSYLNFLDLYNVFEIQSIEQVDFFLGEYAVEKETISCQRENISNGLFTALKANAKLKIDDYSELLDIPDSAKTGLIVVEDIDAVSVIIAVNYAHLFKAEILVVEPLKKNEDREILLLIEEWRNGNPLSYTELEEKVNKRIVNKSLKDYEFITFFTIGLPYSLIIKNEAPSSYVNLHTLPDLFIFNNLFSEGQLPIGSAIVFSPQFFKENEETDFLVKSLSQQEYYIRKLLGKEASVFNLDKNVQEFPFDILHICSHGGEVKGCTITEEFTDSAGSNHKV